MDGWDDNDWLSHGGWMDHTGDGMGIAAIMGVSQARVSKLESGDLSRTELGTLQSYIAAIGGQLKIVAEFDEKNDSVDRVKHSNGK